MNINLQKILFGLLFFLLIICILLFNSSFQQKLLTNYLVYNQISKNIDILFQNFEYDVLDGQFQTDLCVTRKTDQIIDTVLFVPELDVKISLFDLLFSDKIK